MSDESEINAEREEVVEIRGSAVTGLRGLCWLFLSPKRAIPLLFQPMWPHFLATLVGMYLVFPAAAAYSSDPSPHLSEMFIALNKQFPITPADFKQSVFYVFAFGFVISLMTFGVLQKAIFVIQGQQITFVDSLASMAYAMFPLFLALMVRYTLEYLTDGTLTPLSYSIWVAVVAVASLWGIYLWFQALAMITELSFGKIMASGILIAVVPLFIMLLLVAGYNYRIYRSVPSDDELSRNVEYLKDSLKYESDEKTSPDD